METETVMAICEVLLVVIGIIDLVIESRREGRTVDIQERKTPRHFAEGAG